MEVCRACTSSCKLMFPLDDTFIEQYNLLTSLNISKCDGLPQYSCKKCMDTLSTFVDFREKCRLTETTLQETLLQKPKIEDITGGNNKEWELGLHIKEEFSDSDIYLDNIGNESDNLELNYEYIKIEHKGVSPSNKRLLRVSKNAAVKNIKKYSQEKKSDKEDIILFCGICPQTLKKSDLLSHLEKHRNDTQCSQCSEFFSDWPQIMAHRFTHIPEDQKRCLICNKKYSSEVNFEFHFRKNHADTLVKVNCRKCDKSFYKPKTLKSHMQLCHSSNKYICDICDKEYRFKTSLQNHMYTHSAEKKKCDYCNYSTTSMINLYAHRHAVHLTSFKCEKCGSKFISQHNLDKHSCSSKICPICGKNLSSKHFGNHLISHNDAAHYKCDQCPATYRSKSGLQVHMDKHKGIKKHQCKSCMKKFFSRSVLSKHMRTHTGEKPYVCNICQKGFTGNNNLKVHMKVHGLHIINKKNKEISNEPKKI